MKSWPCSYRSPNPTHARACLFLQACSRAATSVCAEAFNGRKSIVIRVRRCRNAVCMIGSLVLLSAYLGGVVDSPQGVGARDISKKNKGFDKIL